MGDTWKKFLRKHPGMTVLLIGMIVIASIVALSVFLWVMADVQVTGIVPTILGEWTVGYFLTFILNVILWELIFVASWVLLLIAIIYFQWYKQLPEDEQKEYGRNSDKSSAENGFSFFVGLIWLGVVWFTGKWNLAFQEWTFNDWIYSWLIACLPILLIAGIFGTIYLVWSLRKDSKLTTVI